RLWLASSAPARPSPAPAAGVPPPARLALPSRLSARDAPSTRPEVAPAVAPALRLGHAVALGLAQGPAELLPISSSAHTNLIPMLAGWAYPADAELRKSFEVALHAGAGLGLALEMRADLIREAIGVDRRQAGVIALSAA